MNKNSNKKIIKLENSKWHIEEQMNAGGFGVIHRAKSEEGERAVAKFVPKSPGADRELLFIDLNGSTNVMPVLDRGEWGDQLVLVMPEAEKSLCDFIEKQGRLIEVDEAIRILCDVAKALVTIEKHVVHRDIKPSNILLLNDAWCLADFGISRYAEATTATDTRKHNLTPAYAAPEQWRREHATCATDVYAFGVIAYELLSGRRPFEGPSTEDFRLQHLHNHPEPIKDIPDSLGSLIDECLYKAAESRPMPINILERLQNVARPAFKAARRLQRINASVVKQKAEEIRHRSIEKTEAKRRVELSRVADQSLRRIVSLLKQEFEVNAPEVSHTVWSWELDGTKLYVELMENTGPPWRGRNHDLPFDVVSFSKITINIPSDTHGYEGRSHSLWFCDAQEAGLFRWYETAFMYCPLWRKSSSVNPFSLKPDRNASEALSTVSGTEFQPAWPFTPIDQGNESEFIERWIGWFADAASGSLYRPNRMPEKEPDGSWRRS